MGRTSVRLSFHKNRIRLICIVEERDLSARMFDINIRHNNISDEAEAKRTWKGDGFVALIVKQQFAKAVAVPDTSLLKCTHCFLLNWLFEV